MKPCIPKHTGSIDCPDCGEKHTVCELLPEGLLTVPECKQAASNARVDDIIPVYEVHQTDEQGYYTTAAPVVIMVDKQKVSTLWCDPNENGDWIYITEYEDIEQPFLLVDILKERLQEIAFNERVIEGHEVVMREAVDTDF